MYTAACRFLFFVCAYIYASTNSTSLLLRMRLHCCSELLRDFFFIFCLHAFFPLISFFVHVISVLRIIIIILWLTLLLEKYFFVLYY